jgi:hypothetical protein
MPKKVNPKPVKGSSGKVGGGGGTGKSSFGIIGAGLAANVGEKIESTIRSVTKKLWKDVR